MRKICLLLMVMCLVCTTSHAREIYNTKEDKEFMAFAKKELPQLYCMMRSEQEEFRNREPVSITYYGGDGEALCVVPNDKIYYAEDGPTRGKESDGRIEYKNPILHRFKDKKDVKRKVLIMDTSKEYIKMSIKAFEIQRDYTPSDGDFLHDYRIEHPCIIVWHNDIVEPDEMIGMFGIAFDSEFSSWLPRQDQLQDMIDIEDPMKGEWALLDKFHEFCRPFQKLGTMPHPRDLENARDQNDYLDKFNSWEQLWFAFVMKEKYSKQWLTKEQEWVSI